MPFKFQIACLIVLLAQSPILGREEDVYDIFGKTADAQDPNRAEIQKVLKSELGDRFLKAYLAGDSKLAQTLWASVLKKLEKVETIDDINSLLTLRFVLDIPEDQPMKPQYSVESINRFLLAATEKALTKDHRFYADCAGNLARTLEKEKHWKEAIPLRMQQHKLYQKFFGAEKEKPLIILTIIGVDEGKLKNYPQAEATLKSVLDLATKHNYHFSLKKAGSAYCDILIATHKAAEAQRFRDSLYQKFPDLR